MRDEAFAIRREITLKWRNDWRQHTAYTRALNHGFSFTLRSQYTRRVSDYQFTPYFENQVMRKRPYLTREMCIRVVRAPIRAELQENDRYRFWGRVDELGGRFLRGITLSQTPIPFTLIFLTSRAPRARKFLKEWCWITTRKEI